MRTSKYTRHAPRTSSGIASRSSSLIRESPNARNEETRASPMSPPNMYRKIDVYFAGDFNTGTWNCHRSAAENRTNTSFRRLISLHTAAYKHLQALVALAVFSHSLPELIHKPLYCHPAKLVGHGIVFWITPRASFFRHG